MVGGKSGETCATSGTERDAIDQSARLIKGAREKSPRA